MIAAKYLMLRVISNRSTLYFDFTVWRCCCLWVFGVQSAPVFRPFILSL